jgi:rare lipoprotein A
LLAAAAVAATLAACAQPNVVADRSASTAGCRHASSVSGRHAAVAAKRALPTTKSAAAAQDSSYGLASYYTYDPKTASGEKFNSRELTAAHRLPFGTRVQVHRRGDRPVRDGSDQRYGPFVPGRVVDVSAQRAETLGIVDRGVAKVKVDVVDWISVASFAVTLAVSGTIPAVPVTRYRLRPEQLERLHGGPTTPPRSGWAVPPFRARR